MTLDEHLNLPRTFAIDGREFQLSELTLAAKARLQLWIKEHVPHPLKVVQGALTGFNAEEKSLLLDGARRDAQHWPPVIDSPAGSTAIFNNPDGHRALIREGLAAHGTPLDFDVEFLYRRLQKSAAKSREFVHILLGLADEVLDGLGEDGPKPAA